MTKRKRTWTCDGEMNVDSLDSTEYSTESIQDEIMYIAA